MPNIDWSDINTTNMSTLDIRDFVTAGVVCFFARINS